MSRSFLLTDAAGDGDVFLLCLRLTGLYPFTQVGVRHRGASTVRAVTSECVQLSSQWCKYLSDERWSLWVLYSLYLATGDRV